MTFLSALHSLPHAESKKTITPVDYAKRKFHPKQFSLNVEMYSNASEEH